jgi:hypothetical protein
MLNIIVMFSGMKVYQLNLHSLNEYKNLHVQRTTLTQVYSGQNIVETGRATVDELSQRHLCG